LIGPREAEHMAVGGELISVQEALRIGLVDAVAEADQVVNSALEWCQRLLALPPEAMLGTRREARADLSALFEQDTESELREVTATWWRPETQNTLRALADKLGKKKS
jgi:Delta3-Delta2-enoyl-CoA isomerase